MKRTFCVSIWLAIVAYYLLMLTLGPYGFLAVKHAESMSMAMQENIKKLSGIRDVYIAEWDAIKEDWAANSLEARHIGYFSNDEIVIRMPIEPVAVEKNSTGMCVYYAPEFILSEMQVKEISFAILSASMIIGFFAATLSYVVRKKQHAN